MEAEEGLRRRLGRGAGANPVLPAQQRQGRREEEGKVEQQDEPLVQPRLFAPLLLHQEGERDLAEHGHDNLGQQQRRRGVIKNAGSDSEEQQQHKKPCPSNDKCGCCPSTAGGLAKMMLGGNATGAGESSSSPCCSTSSLSSLGGCSSAGGGIGQQQHHHHRRQRASDDDVSTTSSSSSGVSESDVAEDDMCCFDWALLCEPVTLFCGHTFCRHCVSILLEDAASKGQSPEGSMRCPLCCRALPAVLPEPNVRLRNDLRARYPSLYEQRLQAVKDEYGPEGCFKPRRSAALTAEDLREMLAYRRRMRRHHAAAAAAARGEAGAGDDEVLRNEERRRMEEEDLDDGFLLDGDEDGDLDGDDEEVDDPVLETVELFQTQLLHIWRRRRTWCWIVAGAVLLLGFTPIRQAELPTKAIYVDSIMRVESWRQWWALGRLSDHDTCGLDYPNGPESTNVFPGSELLATVLMYPSWGWVERMARGLEGTVVDAYRVMTHPSPATLVSAFPGLAMASYALCHPGWSPLFREAVAFLAVEGEVRQLMAVLTILTIPTRIPRDPRDIPPLAQMPVYAWTVLSLSLSQGAYLLVCNMVASLLDIAALAPLVLGLSHGLYWRSEASLAALMATRVWFMLREDLGLFRKWLGNKPRGPVEATAVRLLLGIFVLLSHWWGQAQGAELYNSTDLVSALANAGDAIVHDIMDEMDKAAATPFQSHQQQGQHPALTLVSGALA